MTRPLLSASCAFFTSASLRAASPPRLASRSSLVMVFSTVCRSARMSSVSMVATSLAGSIRPSTWMTSSSSNTRTTSQIASDSRIAAKNWLPRPFSRGRTAHDPGDVDEGDGRADDLLGVEHLGQHVEAFVGNCDDAHVGLDRREGVVRRQHVILRQRVEQRRFSDVGQSDNADRQAHRGVQATVTMPQASGGAHPLSSKNARSRRRRRFRSVRRL